MKAVNHSKRALLVGFGLLFVIACGTVIATAPRDGHSGNFPEREAVREAMERFVGPGGLEVIEYTASGNVWAARLKYRPLEKNAGTLAAIEDNLHAYTLRHPKWKYDTSLGRDRMAKIARASVAPWWKSDSNCALWLPDNSGFFLARAGSIDDEWNVLYFRR